MNKRRLSIAFVVCLISLIVMLICDDSNKSESDEVKYESWVHTSSVSLRLNKWYRQLPGPLAGIFASSAEFVGHWRLRQSSEVVI